ncbi:cob(I)alamin adenosyltransferase [Thermanaerovibrio velox DSM 12556]|uniref:Cob(I)alamin adenosyltransferase n=1 Tax=Thermanaerovibrio velox DSM 12556 TaxID=926567 RepID=H0UR23_9BACT|nr:cob(I)yrinic acid a,c-diamide adenosyltransferase [Thermanaerovibrio velox]EHM10860.1 cob(I)alamin adenosyltransferase [Thermanaerovibrio velox DSM 12556]
MGMVQVYTGNGKGKTTAALGLAVRAVGHGRRVKMIQFLKGWDFYGEIRGAGFLEGFELVRTGTADYVPKGGARDVDFSEARRGLELAREALSSGAYDLVILDEVNVAMDYGLLNVEEVLEVIGGRHERTEVVLTGRYAPEEVIAAADLVTEMREVKHPYQKGVKAREGIEY